MVNLDQSEWDVHEWLDAATSGYKPDGESVRVKRVEDDTIVTVCYSGGSHFGSGGYYAGAVYAGEEPEFVEYGEGRRTSFIADYVGKFRVRAPSIIYEYSGDSINGGRTFTKHVTVCASDQQIEEAKQIVAERRRAEAESADFTSLKEYLKGEWEADADHARRYMWKGACWCGGSGHREFSTYWESKMLSENQVDESALARLPADVAAGIRKASAEGKGRQVLEEARAELEAVRKAERKAFARTQINKLVEMGFSRGRAVNIMKAAGPGRCVDAVEWAQYALDTIGSVDALDCLLSGAGGTNSFGKDRMEGALRAFGLEPPNVSSSGALFAILRGAHAALLAGLPAREVSEDNAATA